ncbi:ParB-like nuclease family protein [Streptomyces sp. Ag109_O5-1]|uniref:ParB/RepB/Spo0J family partition protein n=1 Tax=Streptomyces sp. Ag109_O5-1 TaxID=1938851 RepID=UPI000F5033C9|nr:ParB N-terminal domain-containing protein [Streptomyces sp. Ag109_O5-1]RPE39763.1 ParB-like nuclease family protein [Streptomyces sp. Ag109_O5-1]
MPAVYVETREVPLDELTSFPGNAKRGDVASIQVSIRRNGQYRSLIVRQVENGPLIVLAGNHTMQALKAEGYETARCEIVTCDDAEARRINLADNKLAEMGTYDNDDLVELLSYLDGDYEGTGYNEHDIEMLITPPPDLDSLADELGDPEEDDLWPILRFKVPPNVRDDFYDLSTGCEVPDDDGARFIFIMNKLRALT